MSTVPAKNPCGSCPYRKDVPSGVWAAEEYDKLPAFDNETPFQPPSVFFCHQQNGKLCGGWVACHDMTQSLGLRIAASMGIVPADDIEPILDYTTDVPIFETGQAACDHGKRDIAAPSEKATRTVDRLLKKPTPIPRRVK